MIIGKSNSGYVLEHHVDYETTWDNIIVALGFLLGPEEGGCHSEMFLVEAL
ncbi:MAG: hypothetical protein LBE67_10890 [Kocuria palustris]|nr:hypothetical protein [Kocuria palustris]